LQEEVDAYVILYLSGVMQLRKTYVYDKKGKKYVVVGYLLEVPEEDPKEAADEDTIVCPVCGWILRKYDGTKA
jgi:hypothetical protein